MEPMNMKEVDFHHYCPLCKNAKLDDTEDPCNECLETGAREGTRVPERWVEK